MLVMKRGGGASMTCHGMNINRHVVGLRFYCITQAACRNGVQMPNNVITMTGSEGFGDTQQMTMVAQGRGPPFHVVHVEREAPMATRRNGRKESAAVDNNNGMYPFFQRGISSTTNTDGTCIVCLAPGLLMDVGQRVRGRVCANEKSIRARECKHERVRK